MFGLFSIPRFVFIQFIILVFLTAMSPFSYAEDGINQKLLQKNTAILDSIEKKLENQSYTENELPDSIKEVTSIKSAATQCITQESLLLEKHKADQNTLGIPAKSEPISVKQKRTELTNEILKTEKTLASCRVLILRSEETLKSLTAEQQTLLSARLFAKSADIKRLVVENWNQPSLWLKSIQFFLLNNTGFSLLSSNDFFAIIVISLFSLMLSLVIRKQICGYISKKMMHDSFSNHFARSLLSVLGFYAPHLLISLSVAMYFYSITSTVSPMPFISVVAYGIPMYFSLGVIVEIFLSPRKPAVPFHGLPDFVATALARRLKFFLLLLFVGYLLFTALLIQSLPEETLLLARGILVSIFILNIIWVVQLLGHIPRFADTLILRFGINLVLALVVIAELMGYRNLSSYVIVAVFGSLFVFGLFMLVSRLVKELFDGLEKGELSWQHYVRESLGVKSRKKLPELAWIKFILNAGLWLTLSFFILKMWGLSETSFHYINSVFMEGFSIGSLKIIPARIILAIIVLTVLLAFSRWLRARLERSWLVRTNMERGAREAVATISGYVGVTLSLVIALSITGVEFGNIAIIAGALSVGIGFGLQNIVNNFVSGLILLFERPIKKGDWIVVGTTEGFVKQISIRSTQIQTFDRADIIVPNSDLISGQVTNWMLRDVKGRIRVPIGVAYGTDTSLVKKLLLDVAQQHPSVVVDSSVPEPSVLFMEFGDSALLFELRTFIKNIDQKFTITSDLNFAIDAAFREHNVQIPFPQRDVHIKNDKHDEPPKETY